MDDARFARSCFILLVVAVGGHCARPLPLLAVGGAAELSRGPYVQLATPESAVIVWRTVGPTVPGVRFGTARNKLDQKVEPAAIVTRVSPDVTEHADWPRLHSAPENTHQYEAHLGGLAPATRYYYAVGDDRHKLAGGDADHYFTTHPPAGTETKMRFWVVGDSGNGSPEQAKVHEAMQAFVRGQDRPLDFYLHVGDIAYGEGTDEQFQEFFFQAYAPTLRQIVCWAAMGNHEGHTSRGELGIGPYFDAYVNPTKAEAGGLASGSEVYYSFDYGHAHFVCLDSHDLDRSPAGAMARWLKADLEKNRAAWLVAYWHHPPYSKGSHDSDTESQLVEMRTHIMPILEAGGVDLVLTGHSHIYERSMLMDGAYVTPTTADGVILDDGDGDPQGDGPYRKSAGVHPHGGTINVVAGNGGASLGRKGTMPVMKRVIVEHGSVIVDIDGDTLTAVMVNLDGQRRDLFSLVKRGEVSPTRVPKPRLLPGAELVKATGQSANPKPIRYRSRPPEGAVNLIAPHDDWQYLAGSDPVGNWTLEDYNAVNWPAGKAGFGYGDDDDATVLDMRKKYSVVYLRHTFDVDRRDDVAEVGLVINYDDAFIAYLNGHEVARVGVGEGRGKDAKKISDHEADGFTYFALRDAVQYLAPTDNLLAIEGHNATLDSSDFSLDPYLVVVRKK